MEFSFYVSKVLPVDSDGFAILDATTFGRSGHLFNPSLVTGSTYLKQEANKNLLAEILDKMGEASSRAQGLRAIITNYSKFVASGDNRAYLKIENNKVCGMLKVGKRNLFHYDGTGRVKELKPLCVLDFYVHESVQRLGMGKALFEKMLECEKAEPRKIAYDKPSTKLVSFLKKHYGLSSFVPQNNNFVIFNQYWEDTSKAPLASIKASEAGHMHMDEGRERKSSYITKGATQNNFHKVGRTIIENSGLTFLKNENSDNTVGYSNPSHTTYGSLGMRAGSRGRGSGINRDLEPTADVEPKISSRDLGPRLKDKLERMPIEKERAEARQTPTHMSYTDYQLRTPWASYSGGADTYKPSIPYGNHYNQNYYGNRNK